MKNKAFFYSVAILLLCAKAGMAIAQENYINYKADWKGYNLEQNAGRSNEIITTLNYNESTGMLDSLSFEVEISSFHNTIGVYNMLERMRRPEPFPKLSFKSETIRLKKGKFIVRGLIFYYEQHIPTTIIVSQKEEKDHIQFFGNFSLDSNRFFGRLSPNSNRNPQIDMDFSISFPKTDLK